MNITSNLIFQKKEEGLYECRGRIQGSYSIYLPPDALLIERIVHDKHVQSLQGGGGGVGLSKN